MQKSGFPKCIIMLGFGKSGHIYLMDFLKRLIKCITDEAEGVVGANPEDMSYHVLYSVK